MSSRSASNLQDCFKLLSSLPASPQVAKLHKDAKDLEASRVAMQRAVDEAVVRNPASKLAASEHKTGGMSTGGGPKYGKKNADASSNFEDDSYGSNNDARERAVSSETLHVLQNLVPLDEFSLLSALVDERGQALTELNRDMQVLHETFRDVADLVKQQQEGIDGLERHVTAAADATQQGLDTLIEADKYQRQGTCSVQ